MKKQIKIILIIFLLFGCKKYPEGGKLFSFSGTEQRIAGKYNISEYTVNGVDSISCLNVPGICQTAEIEFVKSNGEANTIKSVCWTFPTNNWRVTDDRLQITITTSYTAGASPLCVILLNQDLSLLWDIQLLNKDYFAIKTYYNNKDYYLKLKFIH